MEEEASDVVIEIIIRTVVNLFQQQPRNRGKEPNYGQYFAFLGRKLSEHLTHNPTCFTRPSVGGFKKYQLVFSVTNTPYS